jgi:hypothetical protein
MTCPGSFRVSQSVNDRGRSSLWAATGSVAHGVAERVLLNGGPVDRDLGQTTNYDGHDITIDQEMIEAVEIYLNAVDPIIAEADYWKAEQRVELTSYWYPNNPPVDLFGTCDLLAYNRKRRRLTIADYKNGAGVYVEHTDNKQMFYYAAGALALLRWAFPNEDPLDVEMIIVQPRVPGHEPVRSYVLPVIDILIWVRAELMPAVAATQATDAPLVLGSGDHNHCRWCPGRVICPAMLATRAQHVFDPVTEGDGPEVHDATDGELATFLDDAERLDVWIAAVREEALQRMQNDGARVPGWGLTPTRPRRVWRDEDELEEAVKKLVRTGVPGPFGEFSPYSPAQMEKHVSAKTWRELQALVDVRSSGVKIARTNPLPEPFDPTKTKEPASWSTLLSRLQVF